jgi:diamine N-acetyltransferase
VTRFLGIEVIRFKRKITGEQLTLRLLRVKDLLILRSTFRPELLPEAGSAGLESFRSPGYLWRRLRSVFQALYMIERKGAYVRSVMGFIGLYDLLIGRRASLSVVLFDPRDRRKGYGRECVGLLVDFLEKTQIVKQVYVEVLRGNFPSLTFFQNMGFKIQATRSDYLLMAKKLDKGNVETEFKAGLHYVSKRSRQGKQVEAT